MNAKKKPILNINTEKKYILRLNLRPLTQTSRSFGSTGHGAFRFDHIKTPFSESIALAKIKTVLLCSEIQISPGIRVARPAITAPRPKLTKKAGKAQHSKVPVELKRVR